jgi:hypothetical protein
MGNVITSKSVLKENAPVIRITNHLNTAYFYADLKSSVANPIHKINVFVIEYGSNPDGSINKEDIKSNTRVEFNATFTTYANNSVGVPIHHFIYTMNNSWYQFKFLYTYISSSREDANEVWYSNASTYFIDNTTPEIFSEYISGLVVNRVKTILDKNKKIQLWYDVTSVDSPKKYQIIKRQTDLNIMSISSVRSIATDTTFTVEPVQESTHNFIFDLAHNNDFQKTIYSFFNNWLPVSGTIEFKFMYNKEQCSFIISGNLQAFASKYFISKYQNGG